MSASSPFSGIHAVVYALFDRDERLDRRAMRRQTQLCLDAGVHGMVALGLATEVAKLTGAERRQLMDWVAEDTNGRVPLAFTIYGSSVAEQVEGAKAAAAAGADWVILQPPMVGSYGAGEYIDFFGRVAGSTDLPVAIQNAPAYMGRGLSVDDIVALTTRFPNIRLLKGEGASIDIERLIATTAGRLPVFNGRGGLEFIDNLRAGCAGLILAPECIDRAVRIHERWQAGDEDAAAAGYAEILPAIVFVMQSLETMIAYGKRLFGERAGLAIHDRAPALRPTDFGLQATRRYARRLGPLTGADAAEPGFA